MINKLKKVLIKYFPGLLLLLLIALFSVFISRYLPKYIGRVFIAGLLGIIISNVAKPDRKVFGEGIKLGLGKFLKLAIVLLGVGISFKEIAKIGGGGILVIISLILVVFSATYIIGRKLGVAMKKILLIAAGISICGNTAVVATAPIVKAEEEEVAMAVGIVTLFGVLGVLLYPMIGIALGMQDLLFGTWAGTAINDTSQVVAAGFIFSEEAGRIATTIKLTRNIMLVPVVVLIAYFYNRKTKDDVKEKADIRKIFPMFVLGFLAVVFLNSFGLPPTPCSPATILIPGMDSGNTSLVSSSTAASGSSR